MKEMKIRITVEILDIRPSVRDLRIAYAEIIPLVAMSNKLIAKK